MIEISIAPIPRKTKSLFWTREPSEQKWLIKADSEEKMVDWIVDLKNKINSYIPDKPPSPLFTSVSSLEANIERRTEDAANNIYDPDSVKLMAYDYSQETLNNKITVD